MSWKDNCNYNKVVLFCEGGKTREEFREEFKLENGSSWNAFKWFSKCKSDFKLETKQGHTNRAYILFSRQSAIEEAKEELKI